MNLEHSMTPLFQKLTEFASREPISFHVPGHKNGTILPKVAESYFKSILPMDLTELPGLDDLHAPKGIIAEAEQFAADYFQSEKTFFLVGGSTAGNLAMILAACSAGEKIIVQRNSHKSILNGLELAGAKPVFMSPEYDGISNRYIATSYETLKQALHEHADAKAVVLTYPDYFGKTYEIGRMIELAHTFNMPVLVDEAHGVHFSLGNPFPPSALELGADVVVQSAHKMAPAMTMASYLHIKSAFMPVERIAYYLQMLQSSSPSYPLMASLDVARSFLATLPDSNREKILISAARVQDAFLSAKNWDVLESDDPLKITLHVKSGLTGYDVAAQFEQEGIYPELATHNQILFIHGLAHFPFLEKLRSVINRIDNRLKLNSNHTELDISGLFSEAIQQLAFPYQDMNRMNTIRISLKEGAGYVAAEAVTPYPPGIPLIQKGERITAGHVNIIEQLINQGATIQHQDIQKGILVFED